MRATERYYAYSTPTDLQKCVLNVTLPGAKAVSKGEEVWYVKRCEREIALKGRGVLQFDNAVISYEVVRGADNAVMIELFSDYWIVNKTTEVLMCCENLPFNYHYFFVDPTPSPSPPPHRHHNGSYLSSSLRWRGAERLRAASTSSSCARRATSGATPSPSTRSIWTDRSKCASSSCVTRSCVQRTPAARSTTPCLSLSLPENSCAPKS